MPTMEAQALTPHHRVSDALEQRVRNRDWFLWITVHRVDPDADLERLALEVEAWLSRHDPDEVEGEPPELDYVARGLRLTLRAIPKKRHARGDDPLVGNPYPAFAYWVSG